MLVTGPKMNISPKIWDSPIIMNFIRLLTYLVFH